MEYTIGNKYIIISEYTVQTGDPYRVNRIDIGVIEKETKKHWLKLDNGKYIKAANCKRFIDITNVPYMNVQFFIDRIEGALR